MRALLGSLVAALLLGAGLAAAAPATADGLPDPAADQPGGRRPRRQQLGLRADQRAPAPGRARARDLRGPQAPAREPLERAARPGLLRVLARLRQPRHPGHPDLGPDPEGVHRQGARSHRRPQGVDGRPLPGRDDAALLHQVPRRAQQGRRPGRPGAVQPRHQRHRARQPAHRGGLRRGLPGLPAAERRLAVPHEPERRRRDPGPRQLHPDHHAVRRGRHAVPLGVPRPGRRRPPTSRCRTSARTTSPSTSRSPPTRSRSSSSSTRSVARGRPTRPSDPPADQSYRGAARYR